MHDYIMPIDLHTEVKTWEKIKEIAEEAIKKYPTTLK